VISVALVDDHPAIQAGLAALFNREPGFGVIVRAGSAGAAIDALCSRTVDIAVADYHLPDRDGLALCRELKRRECCRYAVLYSAFADARLAIASSIAGVDGLVSKGVAAAALFDALRLVARGHAAFPQIPAALLKQAGEVIEPEDLPILGMRIEGTPEHEVAPVLGVTQRELDRRVERMLAALKPRASV
jgi:DNA-binding NarL/FixJ family response regulator